MASNCCNSSGRLLTTRTDVYEAQATPSDTANARGGSWSVFPFGWHTLAQGPFSARWPLRRPACVSYWYRYRSTVQLTDEVGKRRNQYSIRNWRDQQNAPSDPTQPILPDLLFRCSCRRLNANRIEEARLLSAPSLKLHLHCRPRLLGPSLLPFTSIQILLLLFCAFQASPLTCRLSACAHPSASCISEPELAQPVLELDSLLRQSASSALHCHSGRIKGHATVLER